MLEEQKEYFEKMDDELHAKMEKERQFGERDGIQDPNIYKVEV
jgi:hypothetical protein